MKKILYFTLTAIMLLSFSACSGGQTNSPANEPPEIALELTPSSTPELTDNAAEPTNQPASTGEPQAIDDLNALVVYFSMPETTKPDNMTQDEDNSSVVIDGEVLGNTQYVAYVIQQNTGADIFRIEPKTPYPVDHNTLTELADDEKNSNARPQIAQSVENIQQYDVIFLGYPTWWADMPMILYTFLEEYDLSGKTIIPFNTHGGSGFASTIQTITDLQPNATVEQNGFTVSRNLADQSESDVNAWLESLNLAQ